MTTYTEWAARHPQAAAELVRVFTVYGVPQPERSGSEAKVQQQVRLSVARQGAYSWRNNVGATPSKCRDCGARQTPVRYGLANDSTRLNRRMKSSDLILAIPRVITPAMVGSTLAQFGTIECKPVGWKYTGTGREAGQSTWLALIAATGGYAQFSTGEVVL